VKAKLSRQEQFRDRVGIHSLTGFARGFAKTLPARALVIETQRRSLRGIEKTLGREIYKFEKALPLITDPFQRKGVEDTLNVMRGQLGSLRKEFPKLRGAAWAEIFTFVAKLILNQETFYELRDVTTMLQRHLFEIPLLELEDYSI
jgi:hypothetical protein